MHLPLAAKPYSRRERRVLAMIVVFIAAVQCVSFIYLSHLAAQNPHVPVYPIVVSDSTFYSNIADNVLIHHVFAPESNLAPTRAIVPGYPFFLALIKGVTGSFTPAILIQSAFALLAVALLYAIGRRMLPSWLAFLVAFLYGIEPLVVYTTTTVLTDSLFSSLLIACLYIGFFQNRVRGVLRALSLGLLMGVGAMIRLTGLYLIIIVPLFFAIREFFRNPEEREPHPYLSLATYLVCAALLVVPWAMRNHAIFGSYALENASAHGLLDYDVRDFLAWRELSKSGSASVYYPARHPSDPVFATVDAEIAKARAAMTPSGADTEQYTAKVALSFIAAQPFAYAYFHLAHLPVFFLGSSVASYQQVVHQLRDNTGFSTSILYSAKAALGDLLHRERMERALGILIPIGLELVFWTSVVALALLGWFWERRHAEVWLFATIIGFLALLTGTLALARYRIPTEPYLFLLAALGLHGLITRIRRRYGKKLQSFTRIAKIIRYIISGGSAFVASVAIYSFLIYVVGMWYLTASITSFLVAFIISFVLQKFFTFRDPTPPKHGEQVRNYFLVLIVNIALNTVILYALVQFAEMGRFLSLVIANAFIAVWNYFIYAFFIFTGSVIESAPAAAASAEDLKQMSVIIPCHNEAESVGKVIDAVPRGVGEIIVVDNNCTDETAAVARAHGARVVTESRRGYGAAVKAGFASATGSILAVVDGDNQHPSEELGRILGALIDKKLDFISGSRFPLPPHAAMSLTRHVGNWGLTLAANIIFGVSLNDSQTGMVIFRRAILARVEPKGNDVVFVQEMKIRAARDTSIAFAEYHIPCIPRVAGVSKVHPIRNGVRLLLALFFLRARL